MASKLALYLSKNAPYDASTCCVLVVVGCGSSVAAGNSVAVGVGGEVGLGCAVWVAAIPALIVAWMSGVGSGVGVAVGSAARVCSMPMAIVAWISYVGVGAHAVNKANITMTIMIFFMVAPFSICGWTYRNSTSDDFCYHFHPGGVMVVIVRT